MSNPCLVLEVADCESWMPFRGCRRIPSERLPTVLHTSREVAEQEALRLSAAHPGRLFWVFEAATAARAVKVPTHITLGGQVVAERSIPALMELGEFDIPF